MSDRFAHLRENRGVELSVGMLPADLLNLGRDLTRLRNGGVGVVHFDLMDGRFCPEITAGPWFVGSARTEMVKDVHLLVADPENWVEPCVNAGAGIITVHAEAGTHVHRALEIITEVAEATTSPAPARGVGLCPGTPVQVLEPFLDVVDIVYVLGINPGWKQPLLPTVTDRVYAVRELLEKVDPSIRLAVDGGITLANFAEVAALEPDLVVSGSAVFSDGEVESNLKEFAHLGARLEVGSGGA